MQRLRLLYPLLFIILPVLNVLTRNPGGSTLGDVATLLSVLLAACVAVYVLVALVSRRELSHPVVPLIVLAGIICFYAYPSLRTMNRIAHAHAMPAPRLVAGAAGFVVALAIAAVIWWLARRPAYLDRLTTFFALTGLVLVAWSGWQIVADQLAARRAVRDSRLAKELAAPIPVHGQTPALRRDIYLIILDEYANSSVLRERFGFDNREFEDSLRQLGFVIPGQIRSNYVHTLLSIPSLLNFSHLTRLSEELGTHNTDPTLPDYLVEHNRTMAFLKAQGYKFLFFPSQWWISTEHNRNADWQFRAWNGFNPARAVTESDLRRAFVSTTPFALLYNNDAYDADYVRRTLAALERVPERPEATFALVHMLNPHYPYVFDAQCHSLPTRPNRDWGQGREGAYLNQVRCLDALLLGTVTKLLQRTEPAPIILLVGDHGTNSLKYSEAKSAETVSPAQARERFGAFGAFYLPGAGARHLADTLTLVNLVPRVLNHYLGAGIQLAPDKLYMSLERTPYLFAEVDQTSLSR
jgi:sulfatase-like protein